MTHVVVHSGSEKETSQSDRVAPKATSFPLVSTASETRTAMDEALEADMGHACVTRWSLAARTRTKEKEQLIGTEFEKDGQMFCRRWRRSRQISSSMWHCVRSAIKSDVTACSCPWGDHV